MINVYNKNRNSYPTQKEQKAIKLSTKSLFYPKRNQNILSINPGLTLFQQKEKNELKINLSINKILNDSKFDLIESKSCRICFEKETKNNPLINPCQCEGSIKYVHQLCLKNWFIKAKIQPQNAKCEICKFKYYIRFYKDKKFDKISCKRFTIHLIIYFFGMSLISTFLIFCIYRFFYDDKMNVKKKNKFLIISFSSSFSLIFLSCIIITVCSYNTYIKKTFQNFEILNKNKHSLNSSFMSFSLSKNSSIPIPFSNKTKINNFFFNKINLVNNNN